MRWKGDAYLKSSERADENRVLNQERRERTTCSDCKLFLLHIHVRFHLPYSPRV